MNHSVAPLLELSVVPSPAMQTAPSRQAVLGQFFTPAGIADFMADLFTPPDGPVRLLDAGAGKGALTRAFIDRWRGTTAIVSDAYEVDAEVLAALEAGLGKVTEDGVSPHVIATDFIEAAATMIRLDRGPRYTRAILNPPYRKIATGSRERRLAAAAGLETVNLYSAFVGLALDLMQAGGELVAIIPRSFCNGPYYLPFRKWLFGRAALRRVHLFGSRRDAFAGDGVLQENVIIMLERGGEQGDVLVSTSTGSGFEDLAVRTHRFVEIVEPGDPDQVINIPTGDAVVGNGATATLADLGLHVATGPVVDFRLRDHLRREHEEGDAPLLYPQHLKHGRITWPVEGKKPNAISCNDATGKWLIPSGWYVLVKRFSSKEERRRVVATLCDPATLPGKTIGIDNKLNLIRHGKRPLPEDLARGLAIYLNTSDVDRAFRLFSGHTQVNASDLRRMKFPSWTQLEMIGRAAATARPSNQDAIDSCVAAVLDN